MALLGSGFVKRHAGSRTEDISAIISLFWRIYDPIFFLTQSVEIQAMIVERRCTVDTAVGIFWGTGIYTLTEASRLTGVNAQRIGRWVRGYSFRAFGERHGSDPVWSLQLPSVDDKVALGFLDLMEVRFVNAFIEQGVSLQSIRKAAIRAKELFQIDHALCTNAFLTDGRTIMAEIGEEAGEQQLLDLVKNQYAFKKVLRPYLHGIEFDEEVIARWWPLGEKKKVVLDPDRSFGAPITSERGVQTAVIATAVAAEDSIDAVASWYEISKREIRDAVQFESSIAA